MRNDRYDAARHEQACQEGIRPYHADGRFWMANRNEELHGYIFQASFLKRRVANAIANKRNRPAGAGDLFELRRRVHGPNATAIPQEHTSVSNAAEGIRVADCAS